MCEVNEQRWWSYVRGFALKHIKNTSLLDIGRGPYPSSNPMSVISNQYVGIDIDLKENFEGRCIIADAHHLPFKDSAFKAVSLIEVLEHLKNPVSALKEAVRVLENGGEIYITTPNSSYLYYFVKNLFTKNLSDVSASYIENGHLIEFDPRSLKRMLELVKVRIVESKGYLVPIPPRKLFLSTKVGWKIAEFLGRHFPLISSALLIKAVKLT
jgi:SAM-dependent methyltransferase